MAFSIPKSPTDVGGMIATDGGLRATYNPDTTPLVSGGGYTSPTFSPLNLTPTDTSPSIPDSTSGSATIAAGPVSSANGGDTYGQSGTPVGSGGSTTPAVDGGYFGQIVDLVKAQLQSGQAAAQQSFMAAPVLPGGPKYGGAGGATGDGQSSSAGGLRVLLLVALLAAGVWYWRRKHKGA